MISWSQLLIYVGQISAQSLFYGGQILGVRSCCSGSFITNFHNKKMPKEKAPCKCLSIIMIDSVIKANKKYYPQTFLEVYTRKDTN